MTATLEDMLDSFKIRQALERYCRGVDRGDVGLIDSVYWPEATDDHGVWKGPGPEFGTIIVPLINGMYRATMHMILQSNIAVTGNQAAADTYCVAMHRIEKDSIVSADYAFCRYADRFEKRGEEWRIIERTVVMEHVQSFAAPEPGDLDINAFVRGARNREDLSYGVYAKALR